MQGRHIAIPVNPCKQCGANLQGVGPNPHTPYVHCACQTCDKPMTRFLQKFDQLPKISLGGQLGGASIIGEKRAVFHYFSSVSDCLAGCIEAALKPPLWV
jgi:hypothetical protein